MAALRLITAGESHGPGLTCMIEGLPAGLELDRESINRDMARRQLGHGRGGRMKIERDRRRSPAASGTAARSAGRSRCRCVNRDFANWEERMNPWPVDAEVQEVHLPRPGHADLVGTQKYGLQRRAGHPRARERAGDGGAGRRRCAREGVPRALGVQVFSHVIQITGVSAPRPDDLTPGDFADVDESPVRCLDPEATRAMVAEIDRLRRANESLGGVFEVRAFGLVPGLGSHVSWEERLDGRLGQAILSIQAIKAVSIGDGFEVAGVPGSQAHDEIFYDDARGYYRNTNRAGGVEGGMTTGAPLVVRGSMKPLPTLTKPLRSVDIATHEPAEALRERTDSCTVPAAGVVGEAMVAFVLADAYRRKFGGDHIDDVREAVRALQRADRVAGVLTLPTGRAVVCIGFMGAGKSTAARSVAEAIGTSALDVDRALEQRLGKTIERVFAEDGEAAFREAEERLTLELLGSSEHRGSLARRRGDRLERRPRRAQATSRDLGRRRRRRLHGREPRAAAARWPGIADSSSAFTASASRSMRPSPTRRFRRRGRTSRPPLLGALAGAPETRSCCGRRVRRATTRRTSVQGCSSGTASGPDRSPGAGSSSPMDASVACTASCSSRSPGGSRSCRASSPRPSPTRRSSGPSWPGPG